ncbi:hypothetical protein M9458_056239 [Cirrhinus mrigala]|uniref:Uncharacterized protein n=1 Tax=Cirrhinus mrigala TaxID=683832 RepID=A0ABD0MF69_CIRMR
MDSHLLPKDSIQLVDTEPAGTLVSHAGQGHHVQITGLPVHTSINAPLASQVPCRMRKNPDVSPVNGTSSTAECLMVNKASIYRLFDGTTSGPAS